MTTSSLIRKLAVVALVVVGQFAAAQGAVAQTVVEYLHTDALGSPVAVTNQAGQVIERNHYEPYGAVIGNPGFSGVGFTGHVQDGGTGLTYMQQRYYDASVGRFLSVDPVSVDASSGENFNVYWYGNNNPYAYVDPEGACTGSHIENKDGTCKISGDFTTTGRGPTMSGAKTVVHQASIEAQLGFDAGTAVAFGDDYREPGQPTDVEIAAYDAWDRANPGVAPPRDFLNSCEGDSACRGLRDYIGMMLKGPEYASYLAGGRAVVNPRGFQRVCLAAGIGASFCSGKGLDFQRGLDVLEDIIDKGRNRREIRDAVMMETRDRAGKQVVSP